MPKEHRRIGSVFYSPWRAFDRFAGRQRELSFSTKFERGEFVFCSSISPKIDLLYMQRERSRKKSRYGELVNSWKKIDDPLTVCFHVDTMIRCLHVVKIRTLRNIKKIFFVTRSNRGFEDWNLFFATNPWTLLYDFFFFLSFYLILNSTLEWQNVRISRSMNFCFRLTPVFKVR